jgi:hypothetical protein
MTRLLKYLERLLRKYILDSFLAETIPETRFAVALMLSFCIFINNYIALGIFTALIFLLVLCSLETLRENWPIVTLPLGVGVIMGLWAWIFPNSIQYIGVSPILLIWKFFNLCLAAAVFLILLPQRDITLLVRKVRYPQVWAATIAGFRGAEIGAWAFATVIRTRRTKRISFYREPIVWLDTFATGIVGHFLEFLNGFQISLRTRGVESEKFLPREGIKAKSAMDVLVLVMCTLGLVALIKW